MSPASNGGDARATPSEPNVEQYIEGYKAGYAKGYDDGEGAGYSDAKHRTYLALDAAADGRPTHETKHVEEAIARIVGKRT